MKHYIVGGAVRDEILGLAIKDRDYVVVGSTVAEMLSAGYQSVGKDFPVFLHPETHEEYALARTERKTSKGYKGFQVHASPEVTLEEDLARRDLTINAIAKDQAGHYIDPFNGQKDIANQVFRHVSDAFVEDPVRILRVARFAARFPNFTVAEETNALMQEMVRLGEVDALVPERVWQEFAKGLMSEKPSRMLTVLRDCGALAKILPELDRLWGVPQNAQYHPEVDTGIHMEMVMDYAARQGYALPIRFAALAHDFGKGTTPKSVLPSHVGHEIRSVELTKLVVERLKIPNDCKSLAIIVAQYHGKMHQVHQMRTESILKLLYDVDAFRQAERFEDFLKACECDLRGRIGFENAPFTEADRLRDALQKASFINAGEIAKQCETPAQIKAAIFQARLNAIQ